MDSILALPWWGIAWVAGVMLLAGFVHGAIGFGFPLVATPMLTLVLDLKTTILVSLVPTMVMTLISAFRGGMLRESVLRFWFMPIMLVIGSYLGTRILIGANPAHFVLLLAVCLLAFLNLERLGKLEYRSVKENPRFWGVVTGPSTSIHPRTTWRAASSRSRGRSPGSAVSASFASGYSACTTGTRSAA